MKQPTEQEVSKILDMLEEHSPTWVELLRRDRAALHKRIGSQIGEIKRLKAEMRDAEMRI